MNTPYVIALLLMVPGLALVIVPSVPAVPYLFIVTLGYAVATKFSSLSYGELAGFAALAGVALAVDYSSGLIAAKYGGAHKDSLLYGFIGTVAGSLLIPPFGGFAGLFFGILAGELLNHGEIVKALRAAGASAFGSLLGQIAIVITALVYFISFSIAARG